MNRLAVTPAKTLTNVQVVKGDARCRTN